MPYTIEDARAAVARGVQLLDEKKPGWRKEIKPECLVMNAVQHCVLGQSYGTYDTGRRALFPGKAIWERSIMAEECGFDVPDKEEIELSEEELELDEAGDIYRHWYSILDQAWREELTKER